MRSMAASGSAARLGDDDHLVARVDVEVAAGEQTERLREQTRQAAEAARALGDERERHVLAGVVGGELQRCEAAVVEQAADRRRREVVEVLLVLVVMPA